MYRQRLVRQSAVSANSSSESTNMPSPPLLRKRRSSQDSRMYKQLSSDSLDNLLIASSSPSNEERRSGSRRHSIACGILYVDTQKPTLKSAFNSAMRRMSDACSMLSSAPSSTYNLSAQTQTLRKKDGEVILPQVLSTFRQNRLPAPNPSASENVKRSNFQTNRRFSTDCPPPTYTEAISGWKQTTSTQTLLTRQPVVATSQGSFIVVKEDDRGSHNN